MATETEISHWRSLKHLRIGLLVAWLALSVVVTHLPTGRLLPIACLGLFIAAISVGVRERAIRKRYRLDRHGQEVTNPTEQTASISPPALRPISRINNWVILLLFTFFVIALFIALRFLDGVQ
jgi:hypothetical protein